MNVVFFKSKTFCAQELENALKKRPDLSTLLCALPEHIPPNAATSVFDQIQSRLPAIVISINNAGYDMEGALSDLLATSGSYQCNWFVDDPFYEDIFYNRQLPNLKNRLDFITEPAFIPAMKHKGYNAHFLPLATDPLYFNTNEPGKIVRDCAFVGNSSMEFLDSLITKEVSQQLEPFSALLSKLKILYAHNPGSFDIRGYLSSNPGLWEKNNAMDPQRFLFCVEWLTGYFYRRDFIVEIAKTLKDRFTCFGDMYWSKSIDASQVSTDACYYTNLCSYYRSTKVNLNINRIQIKTAFTQRMFDCKAGGSFLLTEKRPLNRQFFKTDGPGKEVAEFSSLNECRKLIDYYCKHDEERQAMALAGRDRVLARHTYDHRLEEMLTVCKKEWGM